MDASRWHQLQTVARAEVGRLMRELPAVLRERAESLPVVFEKAPSRALVADGLEPDVLGLFVGADYAGEGADPVPSEIILFLGNLWAEAEGDEAVFQAEVRTTLLHELGHYLGLDEGELNRRGLE